MNELWIHWIGIRSSAQNCGNRKLERRIGSCHQGSSYTVTVKRYIFSTTARASCNRKMAATMKNHLSPADLMWARRLSATNVADMNPATPATTHLKISNGTTERHCNNKVRIFIMLTVIFTWIIYIYISPFISMINKAITVHGCYWQNLSRNFLRIPLKTIPS